MLCSSPATANGRRWLRDDRAPALQRKGSDTCCNPLFTCSIDRPGGFRHEGVRVSLPHHRLPRSRLGSGWRNVRQDRRCLSWRHLPCVRIGAFRQSENRQDGRRKWRVAGGSLTISALSTASSIAASARLACSRRCRFFRPLSQWRRVRRLPPPRQAASAWRPLCRSSSGSAVSVLKACAPRQSSSRGGSFDNR
jgi:hypothetical protein